MPKPLYQGKLDSFCAVYAVLNALRLTHAIRSARARDILNETLLALSANPDLFRAFLYQDTDYLDVVDMMLAVQKKHLPLEIKRPFAPGAKPSRDEVWRVISDWLGADGERKEGRAAVFRFLRYMSPDKPPINRHWTTAEAISDTTLRLFDCSHEAEAILNIPRDKCAVSAEEIDASRPILIQPDSLRLLRVSV